MILPFLIALVSSAATHPSPIARSARAVPCAAAMKPAAAPQLFLEMVAATARDSVVQVRICLADGPSGRAGSFHLEVEYDSTAGIAVSATPAPAGTQVANTLVPGRVAIAGAAPAGFARGVLSTLRFRRRRAALGPMRLLLRELNAVDGSSLLARAVVRGIGTLPTAPVTAASAVSAPTLVRLQPARATIVPGGVAEVMISGSGFTPTGNVVMFGPAVLGELRSTDGVTLRLLVPNSWPSSGEAPPRQIEAGEYAIRIRNTRGLSNTLVLTLVNP